MSNDEYLLEMGQKIRIARKAKNISLAKMFDLTKIARSNLSHLERGQKNCHILTLKIIADILGMDVKKFL